MPSCIYASATWGIHDQRWVKALSSINYEPIPVRLGFEASNFIELRSIVRQHTDENVPIIAGPLNTVAHSLVGVPGRLIGLSWGSDLYEPIDYTWLSALDGLIVDSQATLEIAARAGVSRDRLTMIPWGIDLELFTVEGPYEDLTRWRVPKGAKVVVTLRAHEPIHRISDVIEAFATVLPKRPNVHLLIGHSGALTEQLQEQAHQLGLDAKVHFTGKIVESELSRLLRAADCYVTASEVDGTSVTLLQAMACGTPVVASDSPGNLGWITPNTTGRLFRTGDVNDLAAQIATTLDGSHKDMSAAAVALVHTNANWRANLSRVKNALMGA